MQLRGGVGYFPIGIARLRVDFWQQQTTYSLYAMLQGAALQRSCTLLLENHVAVACELHILVSDSKQHRTPPLFAGCI